MKLAHRKTVRYRHETFTKMTSRTVGETGQTVTTIVLPDPVPIPGKWDMPLGNDQQNAPTLNHEKTFPQI